MPQSTKLPALGRGARAIVVMPLLAFVVLPAWIGVGRARADDQDVSFLGLGTLPGGLASEARAVSADGSVVVGISQSESGPRAFRWSRGRGMQDLGTLAGPASSESAEALAVDGDGNVVVGRSGGLAFRWTPKEGMVSLGTLPGDTRSEARGVSVDGTVVVGSSGSDISDVAFRWTAERGMEPLGFLPGESWSSANGVNADGSVVVGVSGSYAFRWTSEEGMVAIGDASGGCWEIATEARTVSGDGVTAGGGVWSTYWGCSDECPGACIVYSVGAAFRWSSEWGLVQLGYATFWTSPYVNAINQDGTRMVGTKGSPHVWNAVGQGVEVGAYLAEAGIDLDGWDFTFNPWMPWTVAATGISADGRAVVGGTLHNGISEAWLATIGDPFVDAPPMDLNGDRHVDAADLSILLGAWDTADPQADLNSDGVVDGEDIAILLSAWTG